MLQLVKRIIKTTKKEVYEHLQGVGAFNPDFDGNLLAWYDGDLGLSNTLWEDQSSGGNDLTLLNTPTIISPAINGHDAVRFDGVDQSGIQGGTLSNVQPTTIYSVIDTIVYTGDYLYDSESGVERNALLQGDGIELDSFAGASITTNPNLAAGVYGIITNVFNGVNSEIRTNDSVAVTGNSGTQELIGITIGANNSRTQHGNVEIAYMIYRDGADSTATQNIIINYLLARFAL